MKTNKCSKDNKNIEVELKFLLIEEKSNTDTNKQIKSFKEKLMSNNYQHTKTLFHKDIYYQHPCRNFAKTDEALRLRTIIDELNEMEQHFITYKGTKLFDVGKTREELEIAIEKPQKMKKIFSRLGFQSVHQINKKREVWLNKDKEYSIELSLDQVESLGVFVEIETFAKSKEKAEQATKKIIELSKSLGLENNIRMSYLELLLEQK